MLKHRATHLHFTVSLNCIRTFVEGASLHHTDLLQEKRARMKILLIDPEKNIPIKKIDAILKDMVELYK